MKITQEIREFAEREGLAEEEALEVGLERKAREFREKGSEIYVPS
jgi:phosphomethylpyrimidine synthase